MIAATSSATTEACQACKPNLLLSQDRIQAELFIRQSDGTWSMSTYQESSESIPVSVIEAELSLAEVYDKVEGIAG